MHMVIRALVRAKTKEEALQRAKQEVFDEICGEGCPFDYYTTFDEEGSSISGRGRWGNITPVAKADSKEGKKLIDEGMKATRDDFMQNMARIRKALDMLSDEELFSEELSDESKVINRLIGEEKNFSGHPMMARYSMHQVGEYRGSSVWLYAEGEGIRNQRDLNLHLDHETDEELWVVPADVHY